MERKLSTLACECGISCYPACTRVIQRLSSDTWTSPEDGPTRAETCRDNKNAVVLTVSMYVLYLNHHRMPTYKISSSSAARQPYVGPGLPQKLLPAEVSIYCFFRFRDKSLFQGGVVSPTPNTRLSWRVVSLSWLVPILKRQDLAFCPCVI
jgi:hypothetical protein